jgi:hypothetical protein
MDRIKKLNSTERKINARKCLVCKTKFEVKSNSHWICSYECSKVENHEVKKKKDQIIKKDWTEKRAKEKESTLTHSDYIQLFQKVFNTYIRFRDKDLPCISCGTKRPVKYDAGHFYPTTYQFLRFNEDNVHKQCSFTCNKNKSGNLSEYRPALIKKIGLERVLWLDNNRHKLLDITIPELIEQIKIYKLKIKEIKNG